ncbi:MAG: outer membrane beta-barrel protein [Beijerinckiaceae bacterium]|nr:outer membrane beta-barrel protein [Beijerinckiaceae bacterium]
MSIRVIRLMGLLSVAVTATGANAQSPGAPAMPKSGYFAGAGVSGNFSNFSTQNVYAIGTSDVYKDDVLVSSGMADGPAVVRMGNGTSLSPNLQLGYYDTFSQNYIWGVKLTYNYLNTSSQVGNVLLPQAGANTPVGGDPVPFTGNAYVRNYQTKVQNQIALLPVIGQAYSKGFVYFGAGPTYSQFRTNIDGLIGFADVNGRPTDVSGAPTNFSATKWVLGGAATVGVTYFISPQWMVDANYVIGTTKSQTAKYSQPFENPNGRDGTDIVGTLVGNSSGKVMTQSVGVTINRVF